MKIDLSAPGARSSKAEKTVDPADLAQRALIFLAADDARVARFLSLTGLDPAELRSLANDNSFLLAVLDHFAGDEGLLLAFAEAESLAPQVIGHARRALGGGDD